MFFEPHFHVLGLIRGGFVDGGCVRDVHNLSGYVLKRLDERVSLRMTMLYQLSHAGVVGRGKTVCWFGRLVFKKDVDGLRELLDAEVKDDRCEHKGRLCPVCGELMVHVCRVANTGLFDYLRFEDCFVLDVADFWVKVPDVFHPRRKKEMFVATGSEVSAYEDYEASYREHEC